MSALAALADSLRALDEDGLTAVLVRRPDAVRGLPPADLDELAERLSHPRLIVHALTDVTLPHLQLLQAACSLPVAARTTGRLAALLGTAEARIDPLLDDLAASALLVRNGDRIVLPDTTDDVFGDPLALGRPLAEQLPSHPVDQLRRQQRVLGLTSGTRRAEVVESLLAFFADPANLTRVLDQAPPQVRDWLHDSTQTTSEWLDDPDDYRRTREALLWLQEHGLVVADRYSYFPELSAELVLALRGPDWHAPFTPDPPPTHAPRTTTASGSVGLLQFAPDLLEVVDRVNRAPVPLVKSGGVGVRELTKLAKACAADEVTVRLALELAVAAGILDADRGRLGAGEQFASWRAASPARQVVTVVQAWWTLGYAPTESVDEDGKAQRPLSRRGAHCGGCVAARRALLDTLAEHGPLLLDELAALTCWRRPLIHVLAQDDARPLASVAHEAGLLGVINGPALTDLGRALLADDPDAMQASVEEQLPATAERATFGSDLTAFVAGTPGATVTTLLDSAADRESRGGAVTWRFSPGSVRRALDEGSSGERLTEALASVAETGLPQPLRYLIKDVARRHGSLRLSPATSVIRGDDPALLAEAAADRRLAKHGLRLLAPTVLAADVEVPALLQALRDAGYLPVLDTPAHDSHDGDGTDDVAAALQRPGRTADTWSADARSAVPARPEQDLREVARALLAGSGPARAASLTARTLSALAPQLAGGGVRLLAHAIDTRGRVGIDYLAGSGARSTRVIAGPELAGPVLVAWCELRDAERVFTLSRIESVYAAD